MDRGEVQEEMELSLRMDFSIFSLILFRFPSFVDRFFSFQQLESKQSIKENDEWQALIYRGGKRTI